ncbi:MAG: hypothetical protein HY819_21775 [Acidobacteria bacterium]|nr:hypothetical protein [Acidobacteriota bacterium]
MKCWRIDLQRKLIYYLNKELAAKNIVALENHLLDCGYCRSKLAQLRTGQAFVEQLKPISLKKDPWDLIEASISKETLKRQPAKINFSKFFLKPNLRAAMWFIGGVLLSSLLLSDIFWTPNNSRDSDKYVETSDREIGFSTENFRLVSINEMSNNTEPHIVTEGYISEIRIDRDGDTTFKLVEKIGISEPFIVCEIIDPIKLPLPEVGSKVKVYGVSRYDEKVNHQWYEVHPVLNIEIVKN